MGIPINKRIKYQMVANILVIKEEMRFEASINVHLLMDDK